MKLLLLILCLVGAAHAQIEVSGTVTKVYDGDSLHITAKQAVYKVRLAEIDAPELKQSFGKESRAALTEAALNQNATANCSSKDRYSRYICNVSIAGNDLSTLQVRQGMAWVYIAYSRKKSHLFLEEHSARQRRLGLWGETSPTAPWEFRKLK